MNTAAQKKITAARIALVADQPFFGVLALSLILVEDPSCPTGWTNGRDLGYNPAWIETLSHALTVGFIVHEVMHNAMGHPWRKGGREHFRFNVACDLAINGDLKDCGFTMGEDWLYPNAEQKGKSAEWIYARLPESKQGKKGECGVGEVRDAPTQPDADGEAPPTEGEWKQKTAEAAQMAKMQGKLPAGLARLAEKSMGERIDVRSLLLRFMTERTKTDYTWTKPNTRYLSQGLYLPALDSISMGEVAIMVDTSGSVDAQSLAYACAIVEDVINECNPVRVSVWYADAEVCRIDRFEQGESFAYPPRGSKLGGGGTDFRPALKAIEAEGSAVCVLCITDMYGSFPNGCDLPVLWLATTDVIAPFGETVPLPI